MGMNRQQGSGGGLWLKTSVALCLGGLCFITGYRLNQGERVIMPKLDQSPLGELPVRALPQERSAKGALTAPTVSPPAVTRPQGKKKGPKSRKKGPKSRRQSLKSRRTSPKSRRTSPQEGRKGPLSGEVRPAVRPLRARAPQPLPQGHPQLPETDHRGHPSFDCSALKSPVPQSEGQATIAALLARQRDPHSGAQGEVSLHALVIGAYYGILGTNWYHLCDAPNGEVLVVSSHQLAPPKSLITVSGRPLFDYTLSDVYRFPIYIKEATLNGAQVSAPQPSLPLGLIEL